MADKLDPMRAVLKEVPLPSPPLPVARSSLEDGGRGPATGSLDAATASQVADLLFELHRNEGNILIAVTHSPDLAARFGRRLELREGTCAEV